MTFDPNAHMSKLKGKDYLEVKWRLVWFRQDHPDWGIRTDIVEHDAQEGRALVKSAITCDGKALAEGHKQETRKDFPDYLEKAETGAIGRALAALGYGTQFAPELEEGERVVDSPIERAPQPAPAVVFVCSDCKHPIIAQDGTFINAGQAEAVKLRYGALFCREHRPTKAA